MYIHYVLIVLEYVLLIDSPGYTLSEYLASRGAKGVNSPCHNWNPLKAPTSYWPVSFILQQPYPAYIRSIKAVRVSMCAVPLKWYIAELLDKIFWDLYLTEQGGYQEANLCRVSPGKMQCHCCDPSSQLPSTDALCSHFVLWVYFLSFQFLNIIMTEK